MNLDYDTVRITIRFENGSDDPNHYPYDEYGFDPVVAGSTWTSSQWIRQLIPAFS